MLDAIRARTPWLVVVLVTGAAVVAAARSSPGTACVVRRDPSVQIRLEALRLRMLDAELAIERALARLDQLDQLDQLATPSAPPPRRCIYRRPIDGGPCSITCAPIALPPAAPAAAR